MDIDTLNAEALAWLDRTANELPHGFTQKRPTSEWEIEKPFLNPFRTIVLSKQTSLEYGVTKDNSFTYKGNSYSLPSGTYKGRGTKVLLEKQETTIILYDLQHQELCRHLISSASGEKIINSDHRREKSPAIRELEDQFCSLVQQPEKARQFLAAIRQDKPRYIRDQILILLQVVHLSTPAIIEEALDFCCQQHIVGAADFKSIVAHYQYQLTDPPQQVLPVKLSHNPLNNQQPDPALIQPATSSIQDYNQF